MMLCADIREEFRRKLYIGEYVTDKSGCKTLEIVGATFIADEPAIFGTVNEDYCRREVDWYDSMSLNVADIPGGPPKIWLDVADEDGYINSNYGWMIYHWDNFLQYEHVREELRTNPDSRRAVMIYTRPSIWTQYNQDGMSDFICTNAVSYLIRDCMLHAHVQMRSNDVVFGYKNDRHWQGVVLNRLAEDLGIPVGNILWTATSLHVYERHFHLIGDMEKGIPTWLR
jgi:thymidylate synthase